jgi:hypothetical protein
MKAAWRRDCLEWRSSRQSRARDDWPGREHRAVGQHCTGYSRLDLRCLRVLPMGRTKSERCPSATQKRTAH